MDNMKEEMITETLKTQWRKAYGFPAHTEEVSSYAEFLEGIIAKQLDLIQSLYDLQKHRAIPICAKCLEALNQQPLIDGKAKLINLLNNWKTKHELPNSELYDYNRGYIKAMNDVINELNRHFDSKRGLDGLEVGDKLIVEFNNGQKYYAVYSNEDEFDVHKPDGNNKYRKQWYKYSSKTIKSWTKI